MLYIDDVFTFNLCDPAGVPVTELFDQSFEAEMSPFTLLASDPVEERKRKGG